jgi:hypothetical protein
MFEYRVELGDMVVTNLGTALPAISGKPAYHVADGGKKNMGYHRYNQQQWGNHGLV